VTIFRASVQPPISSSSIQQILPHRYPFLWIDRVDEFTPGVRIAATKRFSIDDAGTRGYNPQSPFLPMGIILEMVVQLGAVLVLERPEMAGKVAMILQISSAQIFDQVHPGDVLQVEAEVLKIGGRFGELTGKAYRGGTLIAEGTVRFAIANAADVLPG
jgi:3-hydroxymyristoyl/3-hydroxydecanoyl-(acyl carrier protein) dehydratase